MAMFKVVDAKRTAQHLTIGLQGPTQSGKSLGALRLAYGVQQWATARGKGGPICVLETENGRTTIYAPPAGRAACPDGNEHGEFSFDFKMVQLLPPYRPAVYRAALDALRMERPSVIIIDQLTSEWVGEGGMLQMVAEESVRNEYAKWNKPSAEHRYLMGGLDNQACPIICCFRSKEKNKISGGAVIPIGWRAEAETNLPYQMLISFLVGHPEPGCLSMDKNLCDQAGVRSGAVDAHTLANLEGELATPEVGKRLAAWAAGDAVGATADAAAPQS